MASALMALFQDAVARPGRALAILCATQAAVWTLAPALTHSAPPLDVVEMLVWGREGVVATFKHPNLPGLLLEAVRHISFGAFWPVYLVAQCCVVATFVAVYLLGRDQLGPARALAGTLLLTGIFYFSWPTPEVNHNLVQLPLWAWTGFALWRATQTGRLVWWILLGLFAGLSLWAKYSAGVLLAAAGIWMLADARSRAHFFRPGPWVALAVCAIVAAPQVRFLIETDFPAVRLCAGKGEVGQERGAGFVPARPAGGPWRVPADGPGRGAVRRRRRAPAGSGGPAAPFPPHYGPRPPSADCADGRRYRPRAEGYVGDADV